MSPTIVYFCEDRSTRILIFESETALILFVKKQTRNILGEKVQTCLMYFGREEHRDNLNTTVFLAVIFLDGKSVCRTSGSKPVN